MTPPTFFVPGDPQTKGSWRVLPNGKLKRDNAREKPWADTVGWAAKIAGVRPLQGPVRLWLRMWFPRPRKPTYTFPSKNDVDKLARSVMDALTRIAYVDDQQVTDLRTRKRFVSTLHPTPGVTICIEPDLGLDEDD